MCNWRSVKTYNITESKSITLLFCNVGPILLLDISNQEYCTAHVYSKVYMNVHFENIHSISREKDIIFGGFLDSIIGENKFNKFLSIMGAAHCSVLKCYENFK